MQNLLGTNQGFQVLQQNILVVVLGNANEVKKMSMHQVCYICSEAITNPLCMGCLQTEVLHWLKDEKESALADVSEVRDLFMPDEPGSFCVVCKNSNMQVCPHCFSSAVKDVLELNHPELVPEFSELFNFHLHVPRSSAGSA